MNRAYDHYQSYSWHQSHDQATLLLLVPYESSEDDILVRIERNLIIAGVRGQPALLKGRLYGAIDVANSTWQLEPHRSRLSARERTLSNTSTTSTHSSFAVVTDPEISSSFAASLENGMASDADELDVSSPALSSPSSAEDNHHFPVAGSSRQRSRFTTSYPVSPRSGVPSISAASSYSSIESLHSGPTRLLTVHLEKAESMIWPSLIVGPVPEALSPTDLSVYPWEANVTTEANYNMDPSSLVLIGLDLADIRENKSEAFEYFVRAWHQAHVPSATMRLAAHYLLLTISLPELSSNSASSTPSASSCPTPTSSSPSLPDSLPIRPTYGTPSYYLHYLGGASYLAQLYLEAGLLYLEGTATGLLTSSYAGLSSLRASLQSSSHPRLHSSDGTYGTEAWRRDRDTARRYFERARVLDPSLDVPLLPPSPETGASSDPEYAQDGRRSRSRTDSNGNQKHKLPAIEIESIDNVDRAKQVRRRRARKDGDNLSDTNASSTSLVEKRIVPEEEDNTWYLYLPGLVGAGTALLVVGFLSFSSWRKGQGS